MFKPVTRACAALFTLLGSALVVPAAPTAPASLPADSFTVKWVAASGGTNGLAGFQPVTVSAGAGEQSAGVPVAVRGNPAPTVSLRLPEDGTTCLAPAWLTLRAQGSESNGRLTRMEFYKDGALIGTHTFDRQEDTTQPVSLNWFNRTSGRAVFTARAYNDAGAQANSAPAAIRFSEGNVPPSISLSLPDQGNGFNSAAAITLKALATDDDGTITKVEFYDRDTKLGELFARDHPPFFTLTVSFAAPGPHTIRARAYDNAGGITAAQSQQIFVRPLVPYASGFESEQGFTAGPLGAQGGWGSLSAEVANGAPHAGAQAIRLPANPSFPNSAGLKLAPGGAVPPVLFFDFWAKPVADVDANSASSFQTGNAIIALVRTGDQAEILAGHPTEGGTAFKSTGIVVPVAADGSTRHWLHFTVREDYTARHWDLYVGGEMVLADQPGYFSGDLDFVVNGHARTATWLDDLKVTYDNPLFADADKDGMADAWEIAHGLNPTINDRGADPDRDGATNLQEYLFGTDPNDAASVAFADADHNGLPDAWERRYFGHIGIEPNADPDGDGLTNLQEFQNYTDPTKASMAGDGLPDGWKVQQRLNPRRAVPRTQDSDGDGLPDWFEYLTGTNVANAVSSSSGIPDAELDPDGDGLNNLQEYQQGTDPNDYYNGHAPVITPLADYSQQLGPDSMIAVRVTDSAGNILANAPVQFTASAGSLLTQNPYGLGSSATMIARSDDTGIAKIYVRPAQ